MTLLFLKAFSNYFNRTVKRLSSRAEYIDGRTFCEVPTNNFNPNDGISADHIVNWTQEWEPDYLLVTSDDGEEIISRWFVMEWIRTRADQYRAMLRRDVVAENLSSVLSAPCLVDRGPLSASSPYIFNSEDMTLNRIKKSESLIKDETGEPWIVGYVSTDTDAPTPVSIEGPNASSYPSLEDLALVFNDPSDPTQGAKVDSLVSLPRFGIGVRNYSAAQQWQGQINLAYFSSGDDFVEYASGNSFWPNALIILDGSSSSDPDYKVPDSSKWAWAALVKSSRASLTSSLCSREGYSPFESYASLVAANGKVFYSSNYGKYYRLSVSVPTYTEKKYITARPSDDQPAIHYQIKALGITYAEQQTAAGVPMSVVDYGEDTIIYVEVKQVLFSLEEVSAPGQKRISISNGRRKLLDAPFDMFCMRYTQDNLALAQALISRPVADPQNESKKIFDVQIVPFCPRRDYIENGMSLSGMTQDADYQYIEEYDDDSSSWIDSSEVMFWCLRSSDSFSVAANIQIDQDADLSAAESLKVANECDVCRLCSPNYASVFEFSVAKNGGVISWRVDFTYKPISPYIHVAPVFGGIYGTFNNDARGLIVSGDLSVDVVSDAWTQYITNNKNYQEIFNTGIKTMDATHDLEMVERGLGVAGGSVAAGLATGMKTGNVYVGLAAAAVSAGAGIWDLAMFDKNYEIQRAQTVKSFRYTLGNIVAMPQSLSKVTGYNVNNKYFPVVEFYSCTDEEREAVGAYVREFNFKIGLLTNLKAVLSSATKELEYVRGELVRFDSTLAADQHMASEINFELKGGVYLWEYSNQ